MKRIFLISVIFILIIFQNCKNNTNPNLDWVTAKEPKTIKSNLALPSQAQMDWQDMEQTMFICLDPCTWEGVEQGNHTYPIEKMDPSKLDVNQWIDAAEAFGAKMVLFVAKHSSGFCWWQTETSDYSIKNTAYK